MEPNFLLAKIRNASATCGLALAKRLRQKRSRGSHLGAHSEVQQILYNSLHQWDPALGIALATAHTDLVSASYIGIGLVVRGRTRTILEPRSNSISFSCPGWETVPSCSFESRLRAWQCLWNHHCQALPELWNILCRTLWRSVAEPNTILTHGSRHSSNRAATHRQLSLRSAARTPLFLGGPQCALSHPPHWFQHGTSHFPFPSLPLPFAASSRSKCLHWPFR